ncbi:MAG: pirin family protein [Candidatus Gracilibacteria bacterium]|nr:pirin family protein [Candidatus Gracilibacteria bacterium]
MKIEVHENEERGYFNQKWIKSYFSFSYADYHNHKRPGFGKLIVLNEDHIIPGEGFPARPHKDMEIISIPLFGELHHEDSLGNDTNVKAGSVQSISAGSGISHSEYNNHDSDELKVLHIWIESENHNGDPIYEHKKYTKKDRKNKWQVLASCKKKDNANLLQQDAYISRIHITEKKEVEYKKRNKDHGVYFFVIHGCIKVEGNKIMEKDAVGITGAHKKIALKNYYEESDILAIEVPMQLKPKK